MYKLGFEAVHAQPLSRTVMRVVLENSQSNIGTEEESPGTPGDTHRNPTPCMHPCTAPKPTPAPHLPMEHLADIFCVPRVASTLGVAS